MTEDSRKELYELLTQARDLSADIVDFVQEKVGNGAPGEIGRAHV